MDRVDVSYIDPILKPEGELIPVAAEVLRKIPHVHIMQWCHINAVYGLPTIELIDFIKPFITESTIEIGGGDGVFGRALSITSTDSHIQSSADMLLLYKMLQQPPVTYGRNVIKMEAKEAVETYKPHTVFASWVTQYVSDEEKNTAGCYAGVDEIGMADHIKRYVLFGNEMIHGDKKLFKSDKVKNLQIFKSPDFFSRSRDPGANALWVLDF